MSISVIPRVSFVPVQACSVSILIFQAAIQNLLLAVHACVRVCECARAYKCVCVHVCILGEEPLPGTLGRCVHVHECFQPEVSTQTSHWLPLMHLH